MKPESVRDQFLDLDLPTRDQVNCRRKASGRVPDGALYSQTFDTDSRDRKCDIFFSHTSLNKGSTFPCCENAQLDAGLCTRTFQYNIRSITESALFVQLSRNLLRMNYWIRAVLLP